MGELIKAVEGYQYRQAKVDRRILSNTIRVLRAGRVQADKIMLDRIVNAVIYCKYVKTRYGLVYKFI